MRTLNDIIPPSRRQPTSENPPPVELTRQRRGGRFPLGTLIIVLFIVAVSAGTLFYFSSAIIRVTPQSHTATLDSTIYTATFGTSDLAFEVVTVQKVATQSVTSSGTKTVSSAAQGTVTVTNAQNVTQKLIKDTRFQTADGLIFRINAPITIPGAKGGVPGSVTATIYADKPGSEYNIGPTSFTLPGLLGSSQFTLVGAKSSALMSGGASGVEPSVASETESATRAALMDSLSKDLSTTITSQVPEGYVILKGSTSLSYIPMPTAVGASAGQADIKEQGTMRGVALPAIALAKAIALNTLGGEYRGETVLLGSTANLTLKPSTTLAQAGDPSFTFTLSGTVSLISSVDAIRISAAVAGKARSDAQSILKQYPEVAQAVLILRPFWRSSFPQDPNQIKVEVLPLGSN